MKKTYSKIESIILSWGIDPSQFQPSEQLLDQLGEDGKAMTLRSFLKIVRGTKQASLNEARRFAEWLEVPIEHL